jgi:hypothetical protein
MWRVVWPRHPLKMKGNQKTRSVTFAPVICPDRWLRRIIPWVIGLIIALLILKLNVASLSLPSSNLAGKALEDTERQQIAEFLDIPLPTENLTIQRIPLVILHDTAWSMTEDNIREQQENARGPMQLGPNVYVPRQPDPSQDSILDVIARPFFESHRPTATYYEQAADILPVEVRDRLARILWRYTPEALRSTALDRSLTDVPLSTVSVEELKKRSRLWLEANSEENFQSLARKSPHNYFDGAKTTALWAVETICTQVTNDTCTRLQPVFEERHRRVTSTVNIEIVQNPGSHCLTKGRLQALPDYTDYQYRETAKLYLFAALQTGQLPEIVTHFAVDSFLLDRGKLPHCDPRGFDLQRLYDEIARVMDYPEGTRFGILPRYGTNPRQGHNIWWDQRVFGRSSPG